MKQNNEMFLTPVGRMVMGSLYEPQTKSMDGNLLVFKSGKNQGKPRVNYFFALAIKKMGEGDWKQTEWGSKIYSSANQLYPRGEASRPNFSWKIVDGDSQIPNSNGTRPCDRIGYPGHWVLIFGGAFAPVLIDRNKDYLKKENAINCGDYIQVNMQVNSNKSSTPQNIGIVLNCSHVALIGYGEPIEFKSQVDPKTLNISTELPPEASAVPFSTVQPSVDVAAPVTPITQNAPPVMPIPPPPPPYPNILTPPTRQMSPNAPGTYEQMRDAGWTDEQLVINGMFL